MVQKFTCLAQTECEKHGWKFEDVFKYQYRITKSADRTAPLSDDWETLTFGDLTIEHCPALPTATITDESGTATGIVLGIAIGPEGKCLDKIVTLALNGPALEQWIEQLAGWFVILATFGSQIRFYLDPAGNLSTVYNAGEGILGSSVPIVIKGPLLMHPEIDLARVLEKKERFAFGDTVDTRVMRARPNHYLDMHDFTSHRHWPRSDTPFAELDQSRRACITEIGDRLTSIIGALSASYDCGLPITAGHFGCGDAILGGNKGILLLSLEPLDQSGRGRSDAIGRAACDHVANYFKTFTTGSNASASLF